MSQTEASQTDTKADPTRMVHKKGHTLKKPRGAEDTTVSRITKADAHVLMTLLGEDGTGSGLPSKFYTEFKRQLNSTSNNTIIGLLKQHPDIADEKTLNMVLFQLVKQNHAKGITRINNICPITKTELYALAPENFSTALAFMVVGCPRSRDVDVMVAVDKKDSINGKIKSLSQASTQWILEQLACLGYDVNMRKVDINLVVIDTYTRSITLSAKGDRAQTTNIILATWMHHCQMMSSTNPCLPVMLVRFPLVEVAPSTLDWRNKLSAIAKFVMDHFEALIRSDTYNEMHAKKKEAYEARDNDAKEVKDNDRTGRDTPFDFVKLVFEHPQLITNLGTIEDEDEHERNKCRSAYKSLVMKLLQLFAAYRSDTVNFPQFYTKMELADSVDQLYADRDADTLQNFKECAEWFLFRGTRGTFHDGVFAEWMREYHELVRLHLSSMSFKEFTFSMEQMMEACASTPAICSAMSPEMCEKFIRDPVNCTDAFWYLWCERHPEYATIIGSKFPIASSDRDDFFQFLVTLGASMDVIRVLTQQLDFRDQRSPAWTETHRIFNKSAEPEIKEIPQGYYNLLGGAVGELMLTYFMKNPEVLREFGFAGYTFYTVGFVFNDDGTDCKAPDGVLLGRNADGKIEIIWIEFKKLRTHANDKRRERAFKIASLQTASCSALLVKNVDPSELCIVRSLIVFGCILDGKLVARAFLR